jgi:hypothetical protein
VWVGRAIETAAAAAAGPATDRTPRNDR